MAGRTLQGKTALVTGAGKRIGRAIAIALAEEGVDIVIHYPYAAEEASELCTELHGRRVKSWLVKADFEVAAEYETLIARSLEMAGSLDILVNNASIFPANTLENVDLAALMKNMQVNAWAPFVLSRDFSRLVGRGQIINFLDSRISGYDWKHVAYILSKHVLSVLTKMTALEFAPRIAVNGVAPGLILPPPGKDHTFLDRMADSVPLKRHGDPIYIADAVIYLLKTDFVTGEVINVDGGRHLMEHADVSHID
jgi:pteridine reductase